MRVFLTFLLALAFQAPAFAIGGGGGDGGSSGDQAGGSHRYVLTYSLGGEEEEAPLLGSEDPRVVSFPTIVAPLSRDERLTGFAFVQVRISIASGTDVWDVRERAHYALDLMVKAAYSNVLSAAGGESIDYEQAARVWGEVLRGYFGQQAVDIVEVTGTDTRLLQ